MDNPPAMPRRGLNVFAATASPVGILTVTRHPASPSTSRTACAIIARGTGLMAGSPGGICSPGKVTVPTPSPAQNTIP